MYERHRVECAQNGPLPRKNCGRLGNLNGVRMLVAAPASRLLRFDSFELDVRAAELRKGGIKLRLQGQPIQVLAKLLSCSGELVTREELRAEIWPAETFVDFDHSLHNAIARIREVLGDSAETPRYIETVPRRGYRYIGPVQDFQTPHLDAETGGPTAQPPAALPRPKRSRIPFILFALAVLGFVAWTTWRYVHAK